MRTYQARFSVGPDDEASFRAYAAVFSRALRSLHASRHPGTGLRKSAFMRAFGLTSRQYNAVRSSLDGMESSIVESRPGRIADLAQRVKAIDAKIAKLLNPKPKKAKAKTPKPRHKKREPVPAGLFPQPYLTAKKAADKIAFRVHNLKRRRETLVLKLDALKAEGHPRICFGSRKLFNAQHHLEENGFAGKDAHEQWQAAWRDKRDAQFFVLGSKDETGGCQGCVMTHVGGDRFAVRLRLDGAAKRYVRFQVSLAYGSEHLAKALDVGQAQLYRFKRDAKGWRIFVSTKALETLVISGVRCGAIGIDLNADHVAVSETDRCGNLIGHWKLPLVTAGLSRHAAQTATADVVKELVGIACRVNKPISIELLDFAKKKAQLSYASPGRQRMLSAFAYTRFAQLVKARGYDAGIDVLNVNPAYSSKIGAQTYARRYGLSVHGAAALVLARRAQQFSDRYRTSSRKRSGTTCKDRDGHVPVRVNGGAGSGKARLETYRRSPDGKMFATGDPPLLDSESGVMLMPVVVGETPTCNCYANTRSGVGGRFPTNSSQGNSCP